MAIGFGILGLIVMVGPLLLAAGTVIWLGVRGKPRWSAPSCRQCGYDLRGRDPGRVTNCPECGADLTGDTAVLFIRHGRRWGLVVWGIALLLMPFVGGGGLSVLAYYMESRQVHPHNLASQTTGTILAQIQNNPQRGSWTWDELADRIKAGRLSQQQVEIAMGHLIAHMKATKPNGWKSTFHWQDDFLKAAEQAGLLSDQVLFDFADAYYGPGPIIDPFDRLRSGETRLSLDISYGSPWEFPLGLDLYWDVKRVTLNGQAIEVQAHHVSEDDWYASTTQSLRPGDYEVTFEIECALIDSVKTIGLDHDTPSSKWPKAKKRWSRTVSRPLKVYSLEDEIVGLTTDPKLDPTSLNGVSIKRAVVQPKGDGKQMLVDINVATPYSVALSFDVYVLIDKRIVGTGRMFCFSRGGNSSTNSGSRQTIKLGGIAPTDTHADIALVPNESHVERYPQVVEVWGKEIRFKDVPIERLDLEAEGGGE